MKHLKLIILSIIIVIYGIYEKLFGFGAGANIRIDLFLITPILIITTFFLTKSYISNTTVRLITSIISIIILTYVIGIIIIF